MREPRDTEASVRCRQLAIMIEDEVSKLTLLRIAARLERLCAKAASN